MTIVGFHASHEQLDPRTPPPRRAARRAGGLRRRDVLRPLRPVERAAGTLRLRLELARRGTQATTEFSLGVVTAPGQRYHPAIVRAGDRDAREHVPRPVLGRARQRRGDQRARHRRPVAAEGGARRAPRRDDRGACASCSPARRSRTDGRITVDRARVWTLPEAPPPLFAAAVGADTAARAAGVGRRPHHRRPARRRPPRRRRRLPGRGRPRSGRAAGAPQLGADRRRGDRDRARPVAAGTRRASPHLGTRRPTRRSTRLTAAASDDEVAETVLVSADPAAPPRPPRGTRRPRLRPHLPAPRRHEQDGFIDTFGERVLPELKEVGAMKITDTQRPVVEDGGRLLPRRRDVHGLERRRQRRLRRARASRSTTSPTSA